MFAEFFRHIARFFGASSEGFSSRPGIAEAIAELAAIAASVFLISWFGLYFWNSHITRLFSFARRTDSVLDMIVLFMFVNFIVR